MNYAELHARSAEERAIAGFEFCGIEVQRSLYPTVTGPIFESDFIPDTFALLH